MEWIKFSLDTTTEAVDLVSSELADMGIEGIEIQDHRPITEEEKKAMFIDFLPDPEEDDGTAVVSFYLDRDCDVDAMLQEVTGRLQSLADFVDVGSGRIHVSETKEEDWINNWKAFFKPFRVDEQIVIKPTWETLEESRPGDLVVEIDPGTAFGTGAHETTKLCILGMKKYMKPGDRLLDAGCGSGILGIIGSRLGASEVMAVDIDPNAVRAAEENAGVNQVDMDHFTVKAGDLIGDRGFREEIGTGYDMVLANILADVIIPLSDTIGEQMRPGGIYISSGIIHMKEAETEEAIRKNGFEVLEVNRMGDWVSFVARKPE